MEIELRNYRAFDDSRPVRWRLLDGFVAFVGVNNSGKSSLLRFFHEARPALAALNLNEGSAQTAWSGTPQGFGFQSVADNEEVLCNRNARDMTATFRLAPPEDPAAVGYEPSMLRLRWHRAGAGLTVEVEYEGRACTVAAWGTVDTVTVDVDGGEQVPLDIRRYREQLTAALGNSIYLGPFRNAVNIGGNANYFDLQIGQQFIQQWDQFKTGANRANNRAAIAVERELAQIFDLSNLEINAAPGDATLHIVADDQPYQLQEQGAGLAQFIVVLAFVATRRPEYIFIDEPELNLHPALQVDFLTTLAGYATRGVAFATHSMVSPVLWVRTSTRFDACSMARGRCCRLREPETSSSF